MEEFDWNDPDRRTEIGGTEEEEAIWPGPKYLLT
jgi:hypothetical protein